MPTNNGRRTQNATATLMSQIALLRSEKNAYYIAYKMPKEFGGCPRFKAAINAKSDAIAKSKAKTKEKTKEKSPGSDWHNLIFGVKRETLDRILSSRKFQASTIETICKQMAISKALLSNHKQYKHLLPLKISDFLPGALATETEEQVQIVARKLGFYERTKQIESDIVDGTAVHIGNSYGAFIGKSSEDWALCMETVSAQIDVYKNQTPKAGCRQYLKASVAHALAKRYSGVYMLIAPYKIRDGYEESTDDNDENSAVDPDRYSYMVAALRISEPSSCELDLVLLDNKTDPNDRLSIIRGKLNMPMREKGNKFIKPRFQYRGEMKQEGDGYVSLELSLDTDSAHLEGVAEEYKSDHHRLLMASRPLPDSVNIRCGLSKQNQILSGWFTSLSQRTVEERLKDVPRFNYRADFIGIRLDFAENYEDLWRQHFKMPVDVERDHNISSDTHFMRYSGLTFCANKRELRGYLKKLDMCLNKSVFSTTMKYVNGRLSEKGALQIMDLNYCDLDDSDLI